MKRALTCLSLILTCLVSFSAVLAADVVPPAEPGNLTVTRSGNDVVMTWDAVTTNMLGGAETIGSYRVYRGTLGSFVPDKPGGTNRIGTPASNGFTDTNAITSPSNFFYLISAFDASSNEGNTRPSKVTGAPSLASSFSSSAANLTWTAATPGPSVGGYRVLWGAAPLTYDQGQDVGNTTATSISSLLPGVTYYFAVLAYDTEGNFTLLSNETSGALVGGNGPTEVCGRIDSPTTWSLSGSPYIVTCDVNVWQQGPFNLAPPPPAVLTIEPGVVVKFNSNTRLTIGNGGNPGKLIAAGTALSPILFTANQTFPLPGAWAGIFFTDGADDTSIIERASVQFAGLVGPNGSALTLTSAAPTVRNMSITGSLNYGIFLQTGSPASLQGITIDNVAGAGIRSDSGSPSITGSSITNAGSYGVSISGVNSAVIQNNTLDHGLFMDSDGGEPVITGNTFLRMNGPVNRIGANDVGEYFGSNSLQGTPASLEVMGERVSTNATWPNGGFPLVMMSGATQVYGDAVNIVTLTLGAGLQLRFNLSTYLQVGSGVNRGALVAVGTSGQPLLFTTNNASPAAGQWGGVFFDDGADDATSILEQATVEYAGSIFQSLVRVSASSPRLRQLTLRQSSVYGVYISNGSPLVENCAISNTGNNGIRSDGGGSPTIRNSSIAAPTGYGILFSSTNSARIENNQVANAIQFDSAAGDPIITGNTFMNFDAFPPRVGADDVAEMVASNTMQNASAAGRLEILGEPISINATWPKPVFPYVAFSGDITVGNSPTTLVTLTIAAGNTIRFNSSTNIIVGTTANKGALVAVGTVPAPIVFTTNNATPAPGQWAGILFEDQSDDATSILDRCVVEYSGQSFSGNIRVNAAAPRILNSTIRNSSVRGIYGITSPSPIIQGNTFANNAEFDVYIQGTSNASVTGNTFTSNGVFFDTAAGSHAVTGNTFNTYNNATRNSRVGAHAVAGLGSNTFNATGPNSRWEILGEVLGANASWPNLGFPYAVVSGDVIVGNNPTTLVTLTLAAGTNIRFGSSSTIQVGTSANRGALVAVGTVPLPITLTTNNATPAPGQWAGILFEDQSDDATSIMDRCVVEYAGQTFSGNIRVNAASPRIQNSTIRNSSVRGIYGITSPSPIIQGNTFTNNTDFDVYIQGTSNASVTGNTFTGNGVFFDTAAGTHAVTGNTFNAYNNATRNSRTGAHAIAALTTNTFNGTGANSRWEILGELLGANSTWANLGFPYVVLGDVTVGNNPSTLVTLTLSPGATLRFNSSVSLNVGSSVNRGALVAVGTVPLPITFTTNNATPAPGQWPGIFFEDMSDDATSILDRCVVEYGGQSFSTSVRANSASPRVLNSTIRNSLTRGVYGLSGSSPIVQGNTFTNNGDFDVYIASASNASVTGNSFTNNGVFFDTAAGTHAVTGNTFNSYNNATRNSRTGAHAIGALSTNTFNGTGANSRWEVLGEVLGANATWPNPGFPYVMLGDVTVGNSPSTLVTLTLTAGSTLRFNSSVSLTAGTSVNRGALVAVGTVPLPITFTTNNATPAPGQWPGIFFEDQSDDATSILDRCVVEYAGQSFSSSVRVNGANTRIQNNTIRNSSVRGVYGIGSSSPIVQGNIFTDNLEFDVYISSVSNASVTNNSFTNNGVLFDTAGGTHAVTGNTFNAYNNAARNMRVGAHAVAALASNTFLGTGANSRVEVLGEALTENANWPALAASYVILGNITVAKDSVNAATLAIAAGATLRFNASVGLFIGTTAARGALIADGTGAQPITFTTNNATPAPGQWTAVYFDSLSVGATNLMDNCIVEYGGATYSANVRMVTAGATITNSTIRNSSVHGVYGTSSAPGTVQNNTFANNAQYDVFFDGGDAVITGNTMTHAARIDAVAGTATVQNNIFNTYVAPFLLRVSASSLDTLTGNTFNGTNATSKIEVLGENITGANRWRNTGVPYLMLNNVSVQGTATVAATLTIDPGVTMRWAAGTRLLIASGSQQGELKALGTAGQPILFTTDAAVPAAGQWQGIHLDNGTTFDSAIEFATVEYAGGSSTAGIWLNRADPPIRNATIRFSGFYGLAAIESSPVLENLTINTTASNGIIIQGNSAERTPTITGCVITAPTGYGILSQGTVTATIMGSTVANSISFESAAGSPIVQNNILNNYDAFPVRIGADSIVTLTGNTFNNTGANTRIEILGETLAVDTTWPNPGMPYSVVSGFVTVAKNATSAATLTLTPGTTLKFGTGTRLQIGNSSNMGALVAVGTTGQPITFTSNNAVPAPGQWRGIFFDSGTVDATSIVQNCIVEFGGQSDNGNIIMSSASPTIRNNIIRRSSQYGLVYNSSGGSALFNQIENNGAYGVFMSFSSPTLQHNNFTLNTTGAINQNSTNLIDARFNWYGDASGPAGSGPGTGQAVTTNVVFDPWLGSTSTTTNFFNDMFISSRIFMPGSLTRYAGGVQQGSNWTLRFFDTGNAVVRTINGSGTAITTSWDGRDNGAVNLVNGVYRFQFDATATVGGAIAAPVIGRVTLDNTFANGDVSAPTYLQTFSIGSIVPVLGTASGGNFTNYTLQFGAGLFPSTFSNIVTSSSQVTGASLGNWNTASQTNGIYTVRLLVNNNLAEQTIVNVGTFVLAVNTLTVDRAFFSPNGDTNLDDVTASATLSTNANWTINVINTGTSATVRTFTGSGTSVAQTWNGTLANGTTIAPEGNYRFDLTATSGGQNVAQSSASTALDLTPPTADITAPSDTSNVFTTVGVQGTATDPDLHFLNYTLEFGVGQTPLSYTQISTSTIPVTAGSLGSWITNNFEPTEPIPNGGYELRLRVLDRAGNASIDTVQVNVDNLVLGNVASVPKVLDISQGQTANITFSINKPAAVTVKVYPETAGEAGPIQRQFTGSFPAGNHSLIWDGKNNSAQFLPDEAYVIVVEADAGSGRTDKYSPTGGLGVGAGTGNIDPSYNPYTNDFWTMVYTNFSPGRVTMQVTPTSQPVFDVFTLEPHEQEDFTIEWDGRKPNGDIVTVASSIYFPPPVTLRPHYMLLKGNTPKISGIKSNPYRLFMSYAHVSKLLFTLERDSLVTITLLPPGISNPADPSGRQILASTLMTAGAHELTLDPVDAGIANEDTFMFDEEGSYTFAIQTVNPATGATSLRRGAVSMFR